jgi:hypothetical protein
MLTHVIELVAFVVTGASLVALLAVMRENRRLRVQNAEMQQLVADAAAQATLDSEAAGELLAHLQSMRAENAALKGKM